MLAPALGPTCLLRSSKSHTEPAPAMEEPSLVPPPLYHKDQATWFNMQAFLGFTLPVYASCQNLQASGATW
eukprot:1162034-Pelagomonas_calceolata.AAC.11